MSSNRSRRAPSRRSRRTQRQPDVRTKGAIFERFEERVLMSVAPGTLDNTFNTTGKLSIVAPNGGTAKATTVIAQPDERVLYAGTYTVNGTTSTIINRRTAQGAVDTSFYGGTGVIVPFAVTGMTLEDDGDILVTGGSKLERLMQDGRPDPTFGTNGIITTNVPTGNIAVQSDGKILISGTTGAGKPEITRYTATGAVDTTYGDANGTKVITILGGGAATYSAGAVGLTSDGKAVIALAVLGNPSLATFGIVRLTMGGQFDPSFGLNGVSETKGYGVAGFTGGLVLDSVGTIYQVGTINYGTTASTGYLLAYSADGSHANISPTGLNSVASTVVLGEDNKPIVVGTDVQGTGARKRTFITVTRYNAVNPLAPVWVPDPTWGNAGLQTIAYNDYNALDSFSVGDLGGAVAELADGNVVVAGISVNPGTTTTSFNLTKLVGDASLAASVGTISGTVFFDHNGDGVQTAGVDAGLPGYGIFIDANANGVLDSNEVQVFSDQNGNFEIHGLAAGTYTLVNTLTNGLTHTTPNAGVTATFTSITVAANQTIVDKDIGIN